MPVKPSEKEDRFFFEQEAKRLREQSQQEQAALTVAETKRLKELHFMHCPKCGQKLATEITAEWKWTSAAGVRDCGWTRTSWLRS